MALTQVPTSMLSVPTWTTFTPTLTGSGTAGANTGTLTGKYIKMDKLVFFVMSLTSTSHTGTGNIVLAGLPFNASNNGILFPVTSLATSLPITAGSVLTCYVLPNSASVIVGQAPSGGGGLGSVPLDTGGFALYVQGFYESV